MTHDETPLLKSPSKGKDWIDIAGREAALLSAVEIGLGSLLHSFKIPLTGYFLSLNQCFILSRASLKSRHRTLSFFISNIVAVLKSLSPAGPRLVPMLAISMQGLLHSVGTLLFGANLIGIIVGSVLSSLWSFLQPVAMYYLIFGKTLVDAGQHFFSSGSTYWFYLLAGLVLLKMFLAFLLAWAAYLLPDRIFTRYQLALSRFSSSPRRPPPGEGVREKIILALKDMTHPLFLISLVLTAVFFFVVDAKATQVIWGLLRPLAAGFILFFLIRFISLEGWLQKWTAQRTSRFSQTLQKTVEILKGDKPL